MNEPQSIAGVLELYGWDNGRHYVPDTHSVTMSTAAVLAHTPGPIRMESPRSPQVQNALQAIFDTAPELPTGIKDEWSDLDSFLDLPLSVRVSEINKHLNPHEAVRWAQRADSLMELREIRALRAQAL